MLYKKYRRSGSQKNIDEVSASVVDASKMYISQNS